ncbi:hypothetical protein ATE84_1739 [Aquimarina sp. MAR_2010_214]|uniref:DUF5700 domain-containing putative Zn-dependent protease n=1 Tax=Aquimarina sp. MAR_2010_214 TaxID=1250026 RepID=UPI000C708E64|nr:DUF5700 domain-containing putative Zn-dependent protease [Aquimarina sp. MAR_2010_214]PKV49704.1 hypothetical protein ATE84_1739 [Aquimarina sp. MAR_2010_214]
MKNLSIYFLTLISVLLMSCNSNSKKETHPKNIIRSSIKVKKSSSINKIEDTRIIKVKLGVNSNRISNEWKNVLGSRKSASKLDSLSNVVKQLTKEEQDWINLIESKTSKWNAFRDSLKVPFQNIRLKDTISVLLGYQGGDDAFTYKNKTICLDVNALHKAYGSAKKSVNDNRIDRIFAHEFTHLLHKEWAKENNLKLDTFKDQILWECVTEGFGMYRSMSTKWFPIGDSLSLTSKKTFENLYPKFTERIIKVCTQSNLTSEEENNLHANLSRGSMKKKWGALPVAVWLALEAKGNDKNLVKWVNKGPDAIILLAEKYLTNESKIAFDEFLKSNKSSK